MNTKSMLKIYLIFLLLTNIAQAQEFDVQMNPSLYAGGYNISCNGANTGSISLFISGGLSPYTFVWNDGNTNRNRTNLVAGYYQVTVTSSNGSSVVRELTLTEPELFQAILHPSERGGGYNISENGGNDGYIESQIQGGVPPYTFLWSNGSTDEKAQDLTAGTYSLTVHDATNCTATASITLIEPTVLHIVSISSPIIGNSIYNTSCGRPNGSINLNVAGGTPPYEFNWSNGAFTQNINDIAAGDYLVRVIDQNGVGVEANITLTSSPGVEANIVAFTYGNGKNTSCYTCNNGSISISNIVGVAPFTFTWNSGQTTQNITNIAAGNYNVTITDALGCSSGFGTTIVAPEREVWAMGGNAGTDSTTQFIGTKDNRPLTFKANNSEIFRLIPSNGGSARFTKLLSAEAGIALDAAQTFKISLVSSSAGKTIYYGKQISPIDKCTEISAGGFDNPSHMFEGSIVPWNFISGSSTLKGGMIIGSAPWNGSGTIEVIGTDQNGDAKNPLLINYYCGRNIGLCTNPYKPGIVSTGRHFEVGFPYKPQNGPDIAADIRSTSQTIGLRVESVTEPSGTIPQFNTQLSVDDATTKLMSGKIENASNDKEIFSINGDGETKIGNPSSPSFYVTPSYDAGTNSYSTGKIRIASLGNTNSSINLVQADANGELSIVSSGTLASLGLWQTNGTDVFRPTGKVGIGTSSANGLLTVNGDVQFLNSDNTNESFEIKLSDNDNPTRRGIVLDHDNSGKFKFYINSNQLTPSFNFMDGNTSNPNPNLMAIYPNGKVVIGNPSSLPGDYKLYVSGGVIAERLKIQLTSDWMDKVFDTNYSMLTLDELEKYIKSNKHLPEIPNNAEVLKGGIDVGTIESKLLQKIEELTLYAIEQNKKIIDLEKRIDSTK